MLLHQIPIIWLFFLSVGVVLLIITAGHTIGKWHSKTYGIDSDTYTGSAVAAMLGLLAFILAFTFGMASGRYEKRKALLFEDANSIGTAILRTDLLQESERSTCRRLLLEYVDLRTRDLSTPAVLKEVLLRSEVIQDSLWASATGAVMSDTFSIKNGLFVEALNDMFDMHTMRVSYGIYDRIPNAVWLWLIGILIISMTAIGYQSGLQQKRMLLVNLLLAVIFSSVFVLIVDLDRAGSGSVALVNQPMIDLRDKYAK